MRISSYRITCLSNIKASVWKSIEEIHQFDGSMSYWAKRSNMQIVMQELGEKHGIAGYDELIARTDNEYSKKLVYEVDNEEFVDLVDSLLPQQPLDTGVHLEIAKHLNVPKHKVASAIRVLIYQGRRKRQKEWRLYNEFK